MSYLTCDMISILNTLKNLKKLNLKQLHFSLFPVKQP